MGGSGGIRKPRHPVHRCPPWQLVMHCALSNMIAAPINQTTCLLVHVMMSQMAPLIGVCNTQLSATAAAELPAL